MAVTKLTPLRLALIAITIVFVALAATVLLKGGWSDELNLASAIASGLLVAGALVYWEERQRSRLDDEAINRRTVIFRTITRYIGQELARLASEVQLVGVEDNGEEILLFDSIDEALHAHQSYAGVERMMREVGRRRVQGQGIESLIQVVEPAVSAFFTRLGEHMDVILNHFMAAGDEKVVESLLELWEERLRIDAVASTTNLHRKPTVGEILRMVQGGVTSFRTAQNDYLSAVERVLLLYAELLRSIEGVDSGIPS